MSVILPQQSSTTITVLLIDDDEADLNYWSNTLRNLDKNYTVLTARDRASGVAICRDQTIDCLLLDLDMPESGFEVLLDLIPNPRQPSIPVVILTRLVYPALFEVVKMHGAQDWLVKRSTSAEQLDAAIQRAVASVKLIR
jgi:CheY-like chemotaxis protein